MDSDNGTFRPAGVFDHSVLSSVNAAPRSWNEYDQKRQQGLNTCCPFCSDA
jgi:hypothetical protein